MGFAPFTSERRHFLVEHDSWDDLMNNTRSPAHDSKEYVNDVFLMILETWH